MHWKGGHFEAPVTIDETLFITEHKHYAIRGIVDKTIFGDNSVNTEIIGKNINEISQGYYKVDAGTSVEINAKNGTGTLKSTKDINISSSGAKVNINGKTGIDVTTDGPANIISVGNAVVKSTGGTLDLSSNGNASLVSNNGSVEINAKNGTGTLKSTKDINISSSGAKVNINGKTGITVGSYSYGTSLPGSGSEGEIFFKLIS